MITLENAIGLAASAHAGRVDKLGKPYILHPLRVMGRMQTDEQRIVAVLHDVVEDTPLTLLNLITMGYPMSIVSAIGALTRRKGESYDDYIKRVGFSELASTVKVADLMDNLSRNHELDEPERTKLRLRYTYAILSLLPKVEVYGPLEHSAKALVARSQQRAAFR